MRWPAILRARSRPYHAVQLLGLCKWTRQVHRLLRLLEREEFHPHALTPGDPGVETKRTERELFQLWRVHRPANQLRLSLLPFRHFHARHETATTNTRPAKGRRR